VKLPSLRPLNEGIATGYLYKKDPTILACPNPFNLWVMPRMKGGMIIATQKQKGSIWTKAHHHGADCVGK
jgi:hypothetical protein